MHRNSRIRDAGSRQPFAKYTSARETTSELQSFIPLPSLRLSSCEFLPSPRPASFNPPLRFFHCRSSGRSTYVNFHKYFLHNASYPRNDLGPKPEGGDSRVQRETISAKLQLSLFFSLTLSLLSRTFLNLSARNRCGRDVVFHRLCAIFRSRVITRLPRLINTSPADYPRGNTSRVCKTVSPRCHDRTWLEIHFFPHRTRVKLRVAYVRGRVYQFSLAEKKMVANRTSIRRVRETFDVVRSDCNDYFVLETRSGFFYFFL